MTPGLQQLREVHTLRACEPPSRTHCFHFFARFKNNHKHSNTFETRRWRLRLLLTVFRVRLFLLRLHSPTHCGFSDPRLDSYHGNVGRKIINNSGGAATVRESARPSQGKPKQGGHNGKKHLDQWECRSEQLTARTANHSAPERVASVSPVAFPMECFQPAVRTKLWTHASL